MIVLLSPAKSLDFESPSPSSTSTLPVLLDRSAKLMTTVRKLSADELSALMKISEKLGELNFGRNKKWKKNHTEQNSKSCVFAFQGDVYQGLEAESFTKTQLKFCQKHVRILSGLYGILKPLDLIQPYRLEMGTKLQTKAGSKLYDFWEDTISDEIAAELKTLKSKLIVNLASNEYSTAARFKRLEAEVFSPAFKDWKNGQYKMISFFAKKARGMMAKYIVDHKVTKAADLVGFNYGGYQFNPELTPNEFTPTFSRKIAD